MLQHPINKGGRGAEAVVFSAGAPLPAGGDGDGYTNGSGGNALVGGGAGTFPEPSPTACKISD
jgi:hypothetical protein